MKKIKSFFIIAVCTFALICGLFHVSVANTTFAAISPKEKVVTIEDVVEEIFGDKTINSIEYLYNYDDVADYIYVNFENYGFAVFHSKTFELLEYSPVGNLPYDNSSTKKYYGGPSYYFEKNADNLYQNQITGETVIISQAEAHQIANSIRSGLVSDKEIKSNISVQTFSSASESQKYYTQNSIPNLDDKNLISADLPGSSATKYIANSEYFKDYDPTHGANTMGGCGAIAAQLLLSYNNYYNDRCIIDDKFLFTGQNNPNTVTDPRYKNNQILGSRSGSTGDDSYFLHVLNEIPANSSILKEQNGLRNILNKQTNVNFNIDYEFTLGVLSIDSAPILAEINAERPLIIGMNKNLG